MEHLNIYLSFYLFILTLAFILIALYSSRLKNIAGKNAFILLCISTAIYSFGYAMELSFNTLEIMLFWNYVQYLAAPLIPAIWLTFAFQYTEKEYILNLKVYALIFAIPIITIIMRFTNKYHHLHYRSIKLFDNTNFNVLLIERGFWYYIHFIYTTVVVIITTVMYFKLIVKAKPRMRPNAIIMFLASLFPWVAFFIMIFFQIPYHLDIAPFFMSISTILLLIGFIRYNLLSLKPIARDIVFEWSKDGILILDTNYSVIDYNKKGKEIIMNLGRNSIGENIKQYLNGYTCIASAYKNSQESQFKMSKNGIDYYYGVRSIKVYDKKQSIIGFIVFLQDITELSNTIKKLNQYASTDPLTGVYNRRHFTKISENEILRSKTQKLPLAFIILDLDYFKEINDTYGHLAGDEVIIQVSRILENNIKPSSCLGRYGGEEFLVLLPETTIDEAFTNAEQLRKLIEASTVNYNGQNIKVTASFGVTGTEYVKNEDLSIFLKYADKALYIAKDNGRNCVIKNSINDN